MAAQSAIVRGAENKLSCVLNCHENNVEVSIHLGRDCPLGFTELGKEVKMDL